MTTKALLSSLELTGLEAAPPQICGAVRLVPLLRVGGARNDLRLTLRPYHEGMAVANVGRASYVSYVPHGMVLSWTNDSQDVLASWGGQMRAVQSAKNDGTVADWGFSQVRTLHRMAKREARSKGDNPVNSLRFLPLHLAMEGFLSLHFGGPSIAWSEYSRRAVRFGLTPRVEWTVSGRNIVGFERALRVFEIVEGQVGVLVFVADALASAFVVPHPDDYRRLHPSLLEDFYGELIYQYALFHDEVPHAKATIKDSTVNSVADLRRAVGQMRADFALFHKTLSLGLEGRALHSERVYEAGPFTLQRFRTDLNPEWENHIGEAIVRQEGGSIEYLKTYRLSAAQTRRAYLLQLLAQHEWQMERTAETLQISLQQLIHRLENAGFSYLLDHNVRVAAHRDDPKKKR